MAQDILDDLKRVSVRAEQQFIDDGIVDLNIDVLYLCGLFVERPESIAEIFEIIDGAVDEVIDIVVWFLIDLH